MARTLDEQTRALSPNHPPPVNQNPGFFTPSQQQQQPSYPTQPYQQQLVSPPLPSPQPLAVPMQHQQPPPQQPPPQQGYDSFAPQMAGLSFTAPAGDPRQQRTQSIYAPAGYPAPPAAPPQMPLAANGTGGVPALTAPVPTIASLAAAAPAAGTDPQTRIAWCRDVAFLVERLQQSTTAAEPATGPARIADPELARLAPLAVAYVLALAAGPPAPAAPWVAEAVYLRATFAASGAYPEQVKQNPRAAFRDFEAAARGGHAAAWFRLGRDYENFSDYAHARDCFERGARAGVESCVYVSGPPCRLCAR